MKRVPTWLVVLVLLVVLSGGGVAVLTVKQKQQKVRRELRAAAERHGVDPDILDAIGYVESRWTLGARSTDPRDEARGGSFGPTQISERTARAHGFDGDMKTLGADAWLSSEWTARIMAKRPGGPPRSISDAAAWWNAGRSTFAAVPATDKHGNPHPTRTDYEPRARKALALVQNDPPAEETAA